MLFSFLSSHLYATEGVARSLFDELQKNVFQVRVIDIASGDKYSIGSGFRISDSGYVASNYHVVSAYVQNPEMYRLELVLDNGDSQPLDLISVDVIHDLAILHSDIDGASYLKLAPEELSRGDRIYSMGNPRDLGMTIIEGTYNGLLKESRYQKILFSGSLNAGMSGGPAVDAMGRVIGINVSKGGEQISFLVPVYYLEKLIASVDGATADTDLKQLIGQSLYADQEQFYQSLIQQDFSLETFGDLRLPTRLSNSLKCWGHTADKEDRLYDAVHQHCKSEDQIYLDSEFYVGDFFYDYEWITTDKLNRYQFYELLSERFNHRSHNNAYDDKHVENYRCYTRFVSIDSKRWKVSTCLRPYKDYPQLFDALLLLAAVEFNDRAAVITMGASGISSDNALSLFSKLVESIQWKS